MIVLTTSASSFLNAFRPSLKTSSSGKSRLIKGSDTLTIGTTKFCLSSFLFITPPLSLQNPGGKKVHLSGYGVELAIKSQEYKAKDDTQVQGAHTGIHTVDTHVV